MARRDEAQTVQVGLRVKEPLRVLLEESARERGISMNAEIVRRLERSFEQPGPLDPFALRKELSTVLRDILNASARLAETLEDFYPGERQQQSGEVRATTRTTQDEDQ
jgi:hypothetical protein